MGHMISLKGYAEFMLVAFAIKLVAFLAIVLYLTRGR